MSAHTTVHIISFTTLEMRDQGITFFLFDVHILQLLIAVLNVMTMNVLVVYITFVQTVFCYGFVCKTSFPT